MNTLPKPKYCGQNWLDMKPMNSGRLCGQCEKKIIDFSKKKWIEIEKLQRENNNSICGMYSNKQLEYWGQEIPKKTVGKTLATTTLLIGLVTTNAIGQTQIKNDTIKERTIIQGYVTGETVEGQVNKIKDTNIILEESNIETFTDINGFYRIDITNYIDSLQDPTILFSYLGFKEHEIKLDSSIRGEVTHNVHLIMVDMNDIIAFHVYKPTLMQRIKWKFRKWFGR